MLWDFSDYMASSITIERASVKLRVKGDEPILTLWLYTTTWKFIRPGN